MARNNQKLVPQATAAMERFKYEISREVGVNLQEGYNGDILARDAGKIGGQMVRRMIEMAESSMAGTTTTTTGVARTTGTFSTGSNWSTGSTIPSGITENIGTTRTYGSTGAF